jgi:hypothetical protein
MLTMHFTILSAAALVGLTAMRRFGRHWRYTSGSIKSRLLQKIGQLDFLPFSRFALSSRFLEALVHVAGGKFS